MAMNPELLRRIEESADEWGPAGKYGTSDEHVRAGVEDSTLNKRLGLHPISIRFPEELVKDLKAIAQLNGMSYQPLIREVCKRFVESEKKAIVAAMARRRQDEIQEHQRLDREAAAATEVDQAPEGLRAA